MPCPAGGRRDGRRQRGQSCAGDRGERPRLCRFSRPRSHHRESVLAPGIPGVGAPRRLRGHGEPGASAPGGAAGAVSGQWGRQRCRSRVGALGSAASRGPWCRLRGVPPPPAALGAAGGGRASGRVPSRQAAWLPPAAGTGAPGHCAEARGSCLLAVTCSSGCCLCSTQTCRCRCGLRVVPGEN